MHVRVRGDLLNLRRGRILLLLLVLPLDGVGTTASERGDVLGALETVRVRVSLPRACAWWCAWVVPSCWRGDLHDRERREPDQLSESALLVPLAAAGGRGTLDSVAGVLPGVRAGAAGVDVVNHGRSELR